MIRMPNNLAPNTSQRIFIRVVTVLAALGLGFFAVLGLLDPGAMVPGGDAEGARVFASYMATRNVVLGGAALLLLARRAWPALGLVLVLNAVVQALDAVLGLVRQEVLETVSPAVIAVALFAASAMIFRSSRATLVP